MELLIAATLLSILAVFATSAYRNSTRDTRLQDLKNKTRVMAYGMQRYLEENPNFQNNLWQHRPLSHYDKYPGDLKHEMPGLYSFIDRDKLRDAYWHFFICNGQLDSKSSCYYTADKDFEPFVCLNQREYSKRSDPMFDNSYTYGSYEFCISKDGEEKEYHQVKGKEKTEVRDKK